MAVQTFQKLDQKRQHPSIEDEQPEDTAYCLRVSCVMDSVCVQVLVMMATSAEK